MTPSARGSAQEAGDGPDAGPGRDGAGRAGRNPFLTVLLILTGINLLRSIAVFYGIATHRQGILMNAVTPVGSDFVNLWTTGKLLLLGAVGTIYDPAAFMAFQHDLVGAYIGHRLWAYPPHSLLFAWPFGLPGYFAGLVLWSCLCLAVLWLGARRFGFGWKEAVILVFSPAAFASVYYGQTGNLFAGLLLFALAPRAPADRISAVSAALLTLKPQTGFLIPVLWAFQRRWRLVAVTALVTLLLVALSVALFGLQAWRDYIGLTAPELSRLERFGSGPFTHMIPSLFMSLRLLGMDGNSALAIHLVFAACVAAMLLRRLSRSRDAQVQTALVLVATCLITPYMHLYDLTVLLAAGLLILRRADGQTGMRFYLAAGACSIAWLAPGLVLTFATAGMPIMPLLILAVFFAVREAPANGSSKDLPLSPPSSPGAASG